jgi:hypothetical protein
VYYPPYHSKYNPIERCWSSLEKKWNGILLDRLKVVLQSALRMTWKRRHPTVRRLDGVYPQGVRLTAREMRPYEARLERSATLPKYDIVIKPKPKETEVTSSDKTCPLHRKPPSSMVSRLISMRMGSVEQGVRS